MYINNPGLDIYDPNKRSKDARWYEGKYRVEALTDLTMDLGQKVVLQGRGKEILKDLRTGIALGRPGGGILSSYKYGIQGAALFTVPMVAYSLASAPRYHKASRALGTLTGSLLGASLGGLLAGPIGALVGGAVLSGPIERGVSAGIDKFVDIGRAKARPKLGGGYLDTQQAWTMRQRAAQEIGSSLLNARQYLGNEASLMHQ